ncbi:MAG: hypothetical protein IJG54_03725 [Bacteroidales bacterium]|nr:hypothetical protein [Bacteroidales bacterium]
MKVLREIRVNLDSKQIERLKLFGVKDITHNGLYNICFTDNEEVFKMIEPYLTEWDAWIIKYASFTDEEILSAQYCIKQGMNTCGYPKPDKDFGYINLTYNTEHYCNNCGCGAVQKDSFRISKIPKVKICELGWVYDELFVHRDIFEQLLKPLGIKCRDVKKFKDDSIIDSVVQIDIPETNEQLEIPDDYLFSNEYETSICPICGQIKYDPKIYGFFPLHKKPIAHIYKGFEYFGSGHSAHKKIYISSQLRDTLLKNKLMNLHWLSPCK